MTKLYTFATKAIWVVNPAWCEPIRLLLAKWFNQMIQEDLGLMHKREAVWAFELLPGAIAAHTKAKSGVSTAEWLRQIQTHPQSARALLDWFIATKTIPSPAPSSGQPRGFKLSQLDALTRDGRLNAATKYIDGHGDGASGVLFATMERTTAAAKPLHPSANEDDIFDIQAVMTDPNIPDLELTLADLQTEIPRLPSQSSGGVSGWTYMVIKTLLNKPGRGNSDDARTNLLQAFLAFSNCLLRNGLPPELMEELNKSRLILLQPKPEKIRPIAIADSWLRIVLRCALRAVEVDVRAYLGPDQLCVGVPGGTEILGALDQMVYDQPELASFLIDFRNAFNSTRRRSIYEGLSRGCPRLLKIFCAMYSEPTELYSHTSTDGLAVVCHSETGCRQGDPLAMIYFALAIHGPLQRLRKTLEKRIAELALQDGFSSPPPLHIGAYADDIRIATKAEYLIQCIDLVGPHFLEATGLQINLRKSALVGELATSDLLSLSADPDGSVALIPLCPDGHVSLGRPIGTDNFVRTECNKMTRHMARTYDYLVNYQVDNQLAFALTKHCIAARPQYLARGVHPRCSQDALRAFDEATDRFIGTIVGASNLSTEGSLLRSLPTNMCGLGVPAWGGMDGVQAYNKCGELLREGLTIYENYPVSTLPLPYRPNPLPLLEHLTPHGASSSSSAHFPHQEDLYDLYCSAHAALADVVMTDTLDLGPINPATDAKSQLTLARLTVLARLLRGIVLDPDLFDPNPGAPDKTSLTRLAYALSGLTYHSGPATVRGNSGLALRWSGGHDLRTRIPSREFAIFLRTRLLLPPFITAQTCSSHPEIDLAETPFHALLCRGGPAKGIANARHTHVKFDLAECIRQCFARDPQAAATVAIERTYTFPDGRTLDADIAVIFNANEPTETHWIIDVTVREPCSKEAIASYPLVHRRACMAADADKEKHHAPFLAYSSAYHFIPFSIDSNGSFGDKATNFLNLLITRSGTKVFVNQFLHLSASRIALHTARIQAAAGTARNI